MNQFSCVIKLKTTAAALTTVTFGKVIGAGGNAALGSYVDLDGGNVYLSSELTTTTKPTVDAVFNLTKLYDNGTGLTGVTGTLFGTTTLNATTYGTATVATLSGLTAANHDITITQGSVVYFESATKKGLISIVTLTPETVAAKNDATITIEVKLTSK